MITISTLPQLLDSLGYTHEGSLYQKSFSTHTGVKIAVDLSKKVIHYPTDHGMIVNGDFTCNFSSPENFVVLECVTRLLSKGYRPEHIELEPKWQVGHGASGGRADILIRDNSGSSLLIIECKTAGSEFSKYWNKTLQDGDQLLSYAQNDRSQYLCMYASDYDDSTHSITYQSHIISLRDNDDYIRERNSRAKTEADRALSYSEATNKVGLYRVWRDTYLLDFSTSGIFEESAGIYDEIGKKYFSIHDLIGVKESDIKGKQHEFATIMRKRNIGSREVAFNTLINLILCKIVDEKQNPDNLQAVWKGITSDNHFALQDRLQKLYREGMKKFLTEEITYIEDTEVDQAFSELKRKTVIKDVVKDMFKQLKYFKSNDFSFIEVHNEKLFYENAAVLLDVVRMLQTIRLTGQEKNQFLGDMFEFFLDQGVKQSEGQFFTPMPIVRCIIASLPLQMILSTRETPLSIDYACGAGHFLTELASQMSEYITDPVEMDRVEKGIYGIEKEYRLSKVSKVSAFMYGQDGIQIIHHDALSTHDSIRAGSFSLLVANPPYSVKGFLSTLSESDRKNYSLSKTINDVETNNSIEAFFLERAAELLAPGGVAAIIFPSSILSNSDNTTYIRAREILLSAFEIVAIMELGRGTFGKTGTNTVTLFLRRRPSAPPLDQHYHTIVSEWWDGVDTSGEEFADAELLRSYTIHRGLDTDGYRELFRGEIAPMISTHESFVEYDHAYTDSTEWKQYTTKNVYKSLSEAEKSREKQSRLLQYIRSIETDKMVTYLLAHSQSSPVLIVKSPSDTKGMKEFLGYEWSTAKGNEGIKLFTDSHGRHETPLYDPSSRLAPDRINTLIEASYRGEHLQIPASLQPYVVRSRLVDMLDYDRREFTKVINLSPKQGVENMIENWSGKYPLKKLSEVAHINPSKSEISTFPPDTIVSFIEMSSVSDEGYITQRIDRPLGELRKGSYTYFAENDIIVAKITPCMENGKCAIATGLSSEIGMGSSEFHVIRPKHGLLSRFVFEMINRETVRKNAEKHMTGASGHRRVPASFYENLSLPLPPLDIQSQIVAECEAIDHRVEMARRVVDESRREIEERVRALEGQGYESRKLMDIAFINPSKSEIRELSDDMMISFIEMASVSNDGYIERMAEKSLGEVRKGGYTYFRENDIIIAKITPCMENGKCALATNLTNQVGFGSSEFHVIRVQDGVSPSYVFHSLNQEYIRKEGAKHMTGSSGHRRVPASFYENFILPLPPLSTQLSLVSEIEAIESRIAEAEAVIEGASRAREVVMGKWL